MRRRLVLPLLAMIALAGAPGPAGAATSSLETAVKASYLYKFAPFVEWPQRAFPTATSPLRICVAGDEAIGTMLGMAVRGQRMQDHPIMVTRLATLEPEALSNCQILFLGKSVAAAEKLRGVAGQPVLTVTDRGQGGGIIQFVMQGSRVRFAIDMTAANNAGIQISSKLLGLAVEVAR